MDGGEEGEDDTMDDFPPVDQEEVDGFGSEFDGQIVGEESDDPLCGVELRGEIVLDLCNWLSETHKQCIKFRKVRLHQTIHLIQYQSKPRQTRPQTLPELVPSQ